MYITTAFTRDQKAAGIQATDPCSSAHFSTYFLYLKRNKCMLMLQKNVRNNQQREQRKKQNEP
jgi:hypothetical protein